MSDHVLPIGWCVVVVLMLASPGGVDAVTVGGRDVDCPVCGHTFAVKTYASYGSYVYEWESKYDLIYFPASERFWFWLCPKCGYAQTGDWFEGISDQDARRLRAIFEEEWEPLSSDEIPFTLKLDRVIRTNRLLGRDESFWRDFNRVLIYHYRSESHEQTLRLAQEEIALLERDSPGDREARKRRLYLLGEYHRMLGSDEQARVYLNQSLELRLQRDATLRWGGIVLASAVLAVMIWAGIRRRLWLKASVTVLLAVVVVWSYRPYRQLHAGQTQVNDYYDAIIRARLVMVATDGGRSQRDDDADRPIPLV